MRLGKIQQQQEWKRGLGARPPGKRSGAGKSRPGVVGAVPPPHRSWLRVGSTLRSAGDAVPEPCSVPVPPGPAAVPRAALPEAQGRPGGAPGSGPSPTDLTGGSALPCPGRGSPGGSGGPRSARAPSCSSPACPREPPRTGTFAGLGKFNRETSGSVRQEFQRIPCFMVALTFTYWE